VGVKDYCGYRALDAGYLQDLVLESFAEGEYAFRSQQAYNVVFSSDLVDIGDFGKFYQAVGDLFQFSRLDE
jgi:hypothetical protein